PFAEACPRWIQRAYDAAADSRSGAALGCGAAAGRASTPSGGAASSLRNDSATAANNEPQPITAATTGTVMPLSNMKPAMIGAKIEPPRPTPIAKPVPAARTCVGYAWAKIAYMPLIAALTKNPQAMQIKVICVRSEPTVP